MLPVARRLERATKGEYPGQLARAVIKRLLLALALAMFNNYNGRRGKVGRSRPTEKETARRTGRN